MNSILKLFNLLALLYIFRGAQVVMQIVRQWRPLQQEPLTIEKRHLTDQASFFVAVPPSVVVHEFFHTLVIWYFGGRIVDFGFTFYGGYVTPDRLFVPPEQWLISIAGTIGSLVFGIGLWLALRHNYSRAFRYFGLRSLRVLLIISLIFYPLLAVGGFGDWATIYDFSATPVLSGLTLIAHITILYFFYRADRRGWFEMAGFETVEEQAWFAALEQQEALNPQDTKLTITLISGWWRGDALYKSISSLKRYLQAHPNDADGYAMLAVYQYGIKNQVSRESLANAQKALQIGISNPFWKAMAYRILGDYALARDNYAEAMHQFSEGILGLTAVNQEKAPQAESETVARVFDWLLTTVSYEKAPQRLQAYLYYRRGQALRRQSQYEQAYQDVQQAIELAQTAGVENQSTLYRKELDIIEQHAGRPLGSSHNPPSPKNVI